MKNYIFRIVIIFILAIFAFNITIIYAAEETTVDSVISGGKSFIQSGQGQGTTIDDTKMKESSDFIFNTLLFISFIVVAVVGISLGIKFMMAEPDQKADVKKALITFSIGALVTYGAFGIWKVLVTVLSNLL